jgi:diguanylate cyclase (GGDEF)-like protein
MPTPRWLIFLLLALAAIAVYPVWADGTVAESAWFSAIGLGCAATIVTAVHRRGMAGAAAWRWFAAGIALNSLGTLVAMVFTPDSWPSAGDPLYLALYPALTIGLILLIRARTAGRDWGALVDTTTISTGLGLLTWVFVIRPLAGDASGSLIARVVSIAYPVGDIVLLSMLVRLLLGAGTRNPAFRAIGASLTLFLAGDTAWAVINHVGWVPTPFVNQLLPMGFLLAYALPAAGALHRSAAEVATPDGRDRATLRPLMLVLLSGASLIAPGILALQVLAGDVTDGLAIAIGSAALFMLVVTRMAQLVRHVESQAAQLRDLATIDDLTGLPNRRGWVAALSVAMEQARRDGTPLSVAMLDLDHFKRFNDQLGHQAGDRLLRGAAAAWRDALRGGDQIARYGGEEFIVLLRDAEAATAERVLGRLRPVTPDAQTFSAGVATWAAAETADELIARADRALYRAKQGGRDRIVFADAVTHVAT